MEASHNCVLKLMDFKCSSWSLNYIFRIHGEKLIYLAKRIVTFTGREHKIGDLGEKYTEWSFFLSFCVAGIMRAPNKQRFTSSGQGKIDLGEIPVLFKKS